MPAKGGRGTPCPRRRAASSVAARALPAPAGGAGGGAARRAGGRGPRLLDSGVGGAAGRGGAGGGALRLVVGVGRDDPLGGQLLQAVALAGGALGGQARLLALRLGGLELAPGEGDAGVRHAGVEP